MTNQTLYYCRHALVVVRHMNKTAKDAIQKIKAGGAKKVTPVTKITLGIKAQVGKKVFDKQFRVNRGGDITQIQV